MRSLPSALVSAVNAQKAQVQIVMIQYWQIASKQALAAVCIRRPTRAKAPSTKSHDTFLIGGKQKSESERARSLACSPAHSARSLACSQRSLARLLTALPPPQHTQPPTRAKSASTKIHDTVFVFGKKTDSSNQRVVSTDRSVRTALLLTTP